MDYELLQHKAEQICNSTTCDGPLNKNRMWNEEWILASYPFNCSGNITSLLILKQVSNSFIMEERTEQ